MSDISHSTSLGRSIIQKWKDSARILSLKLLPIRGISGISLIEKTVLFKMQSLQITLCGEAIKMAIRSGSRRQVRFFFIVLLGLVTVSCASLGHTDEKIKQLLKLSADSFNSDIRWQEYKEAKNFVPQSEEDRYWAEVDRMKRDIRLTEYQIRDIDFSEKNRFATVNIQYQYWSLESPVLRSATLTQKWRFNKHKSTWQVVDPDFNAIRKISSNSSQY